MTKTPSDKVRFPNSSQTYIDLLEAWQSKARPVVAWAGAGLSAPAGLPSWPTLKNQVLSEARKYVPSLSEDQQKDKSSKLKAAQTIDNLWLVFEKLEEVLGQPNFEAAVRRSLVGALKSQVPQAYVRLWKLGISGLLTLNIDRLAFRAYTEAFQGQGLIERSGFDVRALIGSIGALDGNKFIANLHGVFEEPPTWVFTEGRRRALFADGRYQEFVRDILKYCTVVMLGMSAGDVAVRDHLRRLKADGIRGTQVYWISSESSAEALALAEDCGIRFIGYKNASGSHQELSFFFDDLETFASPVIDPPPVAGDVKLSAPRVGLPALDELLVMSPNEQREILNSHASAILAEDSEDAYAKFDTFCREYNRAIHAAGLLDAEPGYDRVLNYTLSTLEDTEGGFGTIWRAYDDEGNAYAIKAFKHEIRKNTSLLKAFRRGVRSLKILSKHNIPGIVGYSNACEIPPILVMEWIEGINLYSAVSQGAFRSWETRLRVARDLATAIYSAHSVPVLHRDIKPQNIMLRDFGSEGEQSELVVLDFDLSWHVGALEKSVLAKGANPYLAPEQLATQDGMTSRSAAVDAYGFGMTMYFLCTGHVPHPYMHQSSDWADRLEAIARQPCQTWRSAPRRISRLIDLCTKHDQHLRPSFSQITADVIRLLQMVQGDDVHIDIAAVSEEIAARCESLQGYLADPDGSIHWTSPTQRLRTTIWPGKAGDDLHIKFEYVQTGEEQFSRLSAAGDAIAKVDSHFPSHVLSGRPAFAGSSGHYMNELRFVIEPRKTVAMIEILQRSVSRAMEKLMVAGV